MDTILGTRKDEIFHSCLKRVPQRKQMREHMINERLRSLTLGWTFSRHGISRVSDQRPSIFIRLNAIPAKQITVAILRCNSENLNELFKSSWLIIYHLSLAIMYDAVLAAEFISVNAIHLVNSFLISSNCDRNDWIGSFPPFRFGSLRVQRATEAKRVASGPTSL